MARVVIHPGFVKSASTGLQANLFAHHPGLENIGKPYFNEKRLDVHKFLFDVSVTAFADYDPAAMARRYSEVISSRLSEAKINLISDERLTTVLGMDQTLTATRMRELVGNARIIFIVRRPLEVLKSIYLMHLIEGHHNLAIDQWLELQFTSMRRNSMVSMVAYHKLIDVWARQFGRENVSVFIYEQMQEDIADFTRRLYEAIVVDENADTPLTRGARIRERTNALGYLQRRYPLIETANALARKLLPKSLHEGLKVMAGVRWRVNLKVSDKSIARLEDRVRDSNSGLVQDYGLQLDRYGYTH